MNSITYKINSNIDFTDKVKIGVVLGGGSGKLLAHIFRDFLEFFVKNCTSKRFNKQVILYFNEELKFKEDKPTQETYSSYDLLKDRGNSIGIEMKKQSIKEVEELIALYKYWHREGIEAVFRTSVNAEALYAFRQKVGAIKEILITQQPFVSAKKIERKAIKVLMIRDQIQGFYTNDDYVLNDEETPSEITFQGHFTKAKFQKIIEFAKKRGEKRLEKGFRIWLSYKFHLFGNIIEEWIKEIDPNIEVYQPDTGFTKLFEHLRNKENDQRQDLLFIAGNEVGDLMYEPLIEIIKTTGRKLDLYSKSFMIYLENESKEEYLYELQTVHGSADNKIEEGKEEEILPYATLRLASAIIEKKLGIEGFGGIMDKAVAKVQLKSKLEQENSEPILGCTEIVAAIKKEVEKEYQHIRKP